MPTLPVNPGEIFAGKYRIDEVIGEGGMGVVVLAQHLELDQPVAIKFLLDTIADSAEGAERFRREARAAAKIQSDHVARVYDVGVLETGMRYMVMEYLNGRDLADELVSRGRLPIAYGTRLMLEVLEGVNEAHSAGIIHRDLKPSNVFLAQRPDGRIRVKVLDFGISKAVGIVSAAELSLTKTSAWIGSPLYMAPEQMQSARDVDARADIWSFGAIFYEVLTGEPPYVASSLPQLCALLLSQDPTPLGQKIPEVPADLEHLVMRCLMRDPSARYTTSHELMDDLAMIVARISGSGRDSATGPSSLAPIASRLPRVHPPHEPTLSSANTALADAPLPPGVGEYPTNGNWSSSSGVAASAPSDEAAPSRKAPSKKFAGALALLSLGVVATLAWYALRPPALKEALAPSIATHPPEASELTAHHEPANKPDAEAKVDTNSVDTNSVDTRPSENVAHPAVSEDSLDVEPSSKRPPTKTNGARRPQARTSVTSPTGAQEVSPPGAEATAEPVTPPPAAPARPKVPGDELERFGGRR